MLKKVFEGLGVKICAGYLVIYYILPLLLGGFFNYSYLDFYKGTPEFLYTLPAIIIYFAIFIVIYKFTPEIATPLKNFHIRSFSLPLVNLFITLVFLLLAIKFNSEYGLAYRHSGAAISDSGGYVVVVSLMKVYFSMFLLLKLADLSFGIEITKVDALTIFTGVIGFYFATTASFDILRILIGVLLLILFFTKKDLLTINKKNSSLASAFIVVVTMGVGFVAVLFFGLANKMGFQGAYEFLTTGGAIDFIKIPLARLSVHFYSLSYHLTYSLTDFDFQFESLPNVLNNLAFRIGYLLDIDIEKPDISSTGRLNSLSIYIEPRERNGASPGLIGSIFFIPFFPLSLIFSILYICFVLKKLESIFYESGKNLSLLTVLYALACAQAFTDSQIDMINFVGVGGIQLCFLYLLWFDRPSIRQSS